MTDNTVFIDSFTGNAANLRKGHRTPGNVLEALRHDPRVSVWDMDQAWLRRCLAELEADGKIRDERKEPYPWIRYTIMEKPHANP
jgi:hypothetical protein